MPTNTSPTIASGLPLRSPRRQCRSPGIAGDLKSETEGRKERPKPGHRSHSTAQLSGWAVRHRKPRVDHDLASHRGDSSITNIRSRTGFSPRSSCRCSSSGDKWVGPSLWPREAGRYQQTDARTLEPTIVKIAIFSRLRTGANQPASRYWTSWRPPDSISPRSLGAHHQKTRAAGRDRRVQHVPGNRSSEPLASIRAQLRKSRVKASSTSTRRPASRTQCAI